MTKIAFVILHYNKFEITSDAVRYIMKNCDIDEYEIIIIDNASPNNSFEELQNLYRNTKKINLLQTKKNLGFAGGNNVGLKYAEERFHPEFIVMMNNDVFLDEAELYKKLKKEYESSRFAVAGPQITLLTGDKNSNPYKLFFPTKEWLKYMIGKRKEEIFWARFGLYEKICPFLRNKAYRALHIFCPPEIPYAVLEDESRPAYEQKMYDVGLQGCCYFFSREYIDTINHLCEETFLGGEELVLYLEMIVASKRMVFMPEIKVRHMEGGSTKNIDRRTKREKQLTGFETSKKSYEIALKITEKCKQDNCGKEPYEMMQSPTRFEKQRAKA